MTIWPQAIGGTIQHGSGGEVTTLLVDTYGAIRPPRIARFTHSCRRDRQKRVKQGVWVTAPRTLQSPWLNKGETACHNLHQPIRCSLSSSKNMALTLMRSRMRLNSSVLRRRAGAMPIVARALRPVSYTHLIYAGGICIAGGACLSPLRASHIAYLVPCHPPPYAPTEPWVGTPACRSSARVV